MHHPTDSIAHTTAFGTPVVPIGKQSLYETSVCMYTIIIIIIIINEKILTGLLSDEKNIRTWLLFIPKGSKKNHCKLSSHACRRQQLWREPAVSSKTRTQTHIHTTPPPPKKKYI